jgi:phospholipid/cholesterol/gamma-HCH transport system permease protein
MRRGLAVLEWTTGMIGLGLLRFFATVQHIGAFSLITLGVAVTKLFVAQRVIFPAVQQQLARAGVRLLPIIGFIGAAVGFVIVGQTLSLLAQVGQVGLTGDLLVMVVVREVAPFVAALVVLARVGTATVVELGTARAMGEVETLEALGIDPIHFLVVPRVIGLTCSVMALTVYLTLITLFSGWVFALLANLPYPLAVYFGYIAGALEWYDFVLIGAKTASFGAVSAMVVCYHGLAQPVRIEDVSAATTRTVAQCVVAFGLLDGAFLIPSLMLWTNR